MKKLLLLFSLLLITLSTFAQTAITQTAITETFEGAGRLYWDEHATKHSRALINMDALNIEVLEKNYIAWCLSDLPIIPEYDFKITAKLNVPKINDTDFFGILIDMDKDFNMTAFLFSENIFKARKFNYGNFLPGIGTDIHIKLPESKNKKMEVVIERKGGKYLVSYDNIDTFKWAVDITSPNFGFITSSHLKVEELIIEQNYSVE